MGCLRLRVEAACGKGKTCISAAVTAMNKLVTALTGGCNTEPAVSLQEMNSKVSVSIGLVCSVGLGKYETFYVTEGPFVVEEGVLKVLKDR